MKRIAIILFFILAYSSLLGKDQKYPVSDIPEILLKDVYAINRIDKGEFIIHNAEKAVLKLHHVVTIVNENGDYHAMLNFGYDKFRKITNLSASVYDKNGNEIYRLKKKDIIDQSNISGISLFEDNRVQKIDLRQKNNYPYTIEYEIEYEHYHLYSIPDWYVIPGEKLSVQYSSYSVTTPSKFKPRFSERNIESNMMQEKTEGETTTYRWTFKDLKPITIEPFSNGILELIPTIYAAPTHFSFEGYEGDMSTWNGMAKWHYKLKMDRDILPEVTINEVKLLVEDAPTREEKIRRVYQYMQKRTRYVSIQLGIGGLQPFSAEVVDKMGYGDCKALTNYMHSLLKSIGINSYYTLVEAGSNPTPLDKNFPNHSFNHAILCVPNQADTIWLECTSQTAPFGYLGKFTGDREVLLVTEEGGKIVRTPAYEHEKNLITSHFTISLDEKGNGRAHLARNFKGLGVEYGYLDYYLTLTDKDRKDWMHKNLNLSNYELGPYSFEEKKSRIPSVKLNADLVVRNVASISGKRVFIPVNFMLRKNLPPAKTDARQTPVQIRYSTLTSDTITFLLHKEHLVPEYIPEESKIESDFGTYMLKVLKSKNEITCYRTLRMNKGRYAAEKYEELVEFLKKVREADNKQIVLLDKT